MASRSQYVVALRWCGTFLAVVCVAIWVFAAHWRTLYAWRHGHAALDEGCVWLAHNTQTIYGESGLESPVFTTDQRPLAIKWGLVLPRWTRTNICVRSSSNVNTVFWEHSLLIRMPLWIPLLVIMGPTLLLWCWRRSPTYGKCIDCGYDLTANTSGRCPECGRETTPQHGA